MTTAREPRMRDRRFVFDFVFCAVVAVVVATPYLADGLSAPAAVSVLLASSLMLRRLLPRAALLLGTVGALGQLVVMSVPMLGIVVVPVLVYSVARWGGAKLGQ